jgi:hypothetical protein
MVKKLEKESRRGHRKAWTPYHESKKKTTRFDGPTHTHIHTRTLTQLSLSSFIFVFSLFPISISLSLSLFIFMSFFFVYTWKIPSQPHLIIWSWFLYKHHLISHFLHFNSLIFYIFTALLSSSPPPWE